MRDGGVCVSASSCVRVIGECQMAERLGSRGLLIKRLLVRFPAVPNDVESLGKALHPTCLGENVPVLTVSRSG